MKHFSYTLFFVLYSLSLFSQQKTDGKQTTNSGWTNTKEVLAPSPEKTTVARTKNKNSKAIIVDGILLDKRAAAYYQEEDLKDFSAEKVKKINHIYVDSYSIIEDKLSAQCKDLIKSEFDLGPYNYLRKKDSRVIVPVTFHECTFTISLFSWDEIDQLK